MWWSPGCRQPGGGWHRPWDRGLLGCGEPAAEGPACLFVIPLQKLHFCLFFFFAVTTLPGMLLDILLGFRPKLTLLTKKLSKRHFCSLKKPGLALRRAAHQEGHLPAAAAFSCLGREAGQKVGALEIQRRAGSFAALCVHARSWFYHPV